MLTVIACLPGVIEQRISYSYSRIGSSPQDESPASLAGLFRAR